jgi:hypothetical protein
MYGNPEKNQESSIVRFFTGNNELLNNLKSKRGDPFPAAIIGPFSYLDRRRRSAARTIPSEHLAPIMRVMVLPPSLIGLFFLDPIP